MQWAHAIAVILVVAVAWGAVFIWAELFEQLVREGLHLQAGSKWSKLILAVILTSAFLFVLLCIGGPHRIGTLLGDPFVAPPAPEPEPIPADSGGANGRRVHAENLAVAHHLVLRRPALLGRAAL